MLSRRHYLKQVFPATLLTVVVSCATTPGVSQSPRSSYNPLLLTTTTVQQVDLTVLDQSRQRNIPIRVYLPANSTPSPVVLFSHGLGGSREGNTYMGKHWAGRGYVAIFLQHPGSDESVWKGQPLNQRRAAMQQAASVQNLLLRVKDVPAVLNQLESWNRSRSHLFSGRLDLSRVGMSGHSFGAMTTQAVSGQSISHLGRGQSFTDPRIRAAIAFSPSSPRQGDPAVAFGSVSIPWMLMTGTKDIAPIGNVDLASRRNVYAYLPPGGKYELVLEGAEHSAFTDRALPGDKAARNPNHHRVILALSTAFWDAYLRQDRAARTWLEGSGPRLVLQPKDQWQFK